MSLTADEIQRIAMESWCNSGSSISLYKINNSGVKNRIVRCDSCGMSYLVPEDSRVLVKLQCETCGSDLRLVN